MSPPCENKLQQRLIGSGGSWTPNSKKFTFGITADLSQIILKCSGSLAIGLKIVFSNGQNNETDFENDVNSGNYPKNSFTYVMINVTNKRFNSLNNKFQFCLNDINSLSITCSGCDPSVVSSQDYSLDVSNYAVIEIIAFYGPSQNLNGLTQIGVSWCANKSLDACFGQTSSPGSSIVSIGGFYQNINSILNKIVSIVQYLWKIVFLKNIF